MLYGQYVVLDLGATSFGVASMSNGLQMLPGYCGGPGILYEQGREEDSLLESQKVPTNCSRVRGEMAPFSMESVETLRLIHIVHRTVEGREDESRFWGQKIDALLEVRGRRSDSGLVQGR